ncbi:diphosphomevalonate decarboxylase [Candidatus Gottesmanbacteria bacterium]|nr:diphosphomevalonate decarboxylase [Candidatus Gottesmanbacteria bacterium]
MKATAIAPANIAFIKYWGKKDEKLHLPLNASISMNLSGALTTTTVEFSQKHTADSVDGDFNDKEKSKIVAHLDRIRRVARSNVRAKVITKNSFPKGAGIASSASGFAALTLAASTALGLTLSEKELSIIARCGSGSACRSIPDGFVYWKNGESSDDSYAYSLYPSTYWDLRDIVLIVDRPEKSVPTTGGMERVKTSPFWKERILGIPAKIQAVQYALKHKNIRDLGIVMEEDCVNMHAVVMTQNPPLLYWNETTMAIMQAVRKWRREGLSVYFTIDAGPNVHLIYEGKNEKIVLEKIKRLSGISQLILNRSSAGARLV